MSTNTLRTTVRRTATAAAVAAFLAWGATAQADELVMETGEVRTGTVVSVDDDYVVLRTRIGNQRIDRSAVRKIVRDGEVIETLDTEKPEDAAARLERIEEARVVRSTAPEVTEAPEPDAPATSIGGRDLASVAPGTDVIVYSPPRQFEYAPSAIEIGRRVAARLDVAGVASAMLTLPSPDGADGSTIAVRLVEVQRHVAITNELSRRRVLEGVRAGDWVRMKLRDHSEVSGRFLDADEGFATLTHTESAESSVRVPVPEIIQVDGLVQDSSANALLADLEVGEPLGITMWPDGRQIIGRYSRGGGADGIALDTDDDGEVDLTVDRMAPIAEVRRVPSRVRGIVPVLKPGHVVRVEYEEEFDQVSVRRTRVERVAAVTAYALALEQGDGATIVPLGEVRKLDLIEDDPLEELQKWAIRVTPAHLNPGVSVLPGDDASKATNLAEGVSVLTDGERVTHVFVSEGFEERAFGIRLGEPATQSMRRSSLRFDTRISNDSLDPDASSHREYHSSTANGLRVAIIVDGAGFSRSVEIALAD